MLSMKLFIRDCLRASYALETDHQRAAWLAGWLAGKLAGWLGQARSRRPAPRAMPTRWSHLLGALFHVNEGKISAARRRRPASFPSWRSHSMVAAPIRERRPGFWLTAQTVSSRFRRASLEADDTTGSVLASSDVPNTWCCAPFWVCLAKAH